MATKVIPSMYFQWLPSCSSIHCFVLVPISLNLYNGGGKSKVSTTNRVPWPRRYGIHQVDIYWLLPLSLSLTAEASCGDNMTGLFLMGATTSHIKKHRADRSKTDTETAQDFRIVKNTTKRKLFNDVAYLFRHRIKDK